MLYWYYMYKNLQVYLLSSDFAIVQHHHKGCQQEYTHSDRRHLDLERGREDIIVAVMESLKGVWYTNNCH